MPGHKPRFTATPWGSVSREFTSSPRTATISRTGTWHSIPPPPTTAEGQNVDINIDQDPSYSKFAPPQAWITTRTLGRVLDVKYSSDEAKALWTKYVGDSWTIPPDGRIEMTFQQHLLERLDKGKVTHLLQTLSDVSNRLEYQNPSDFSKRGSFRVIDFGFDPSFEESVMEYRAEVLTGKYRKHQTSNSGKRPDLTKVHTAPWKRMIEVRGLSKKLVGEHETWTQNFRDPWTEALPVVSPILPFLTDREKDSNDKKVTGMNAINQALLHHQQCMSQTPPNDDHLTFHVTFYEVVELTHENELDGEIWRSGKLHSDNEKDLETLFRIKSRRIRESACTVIVVSDSDPQFWTSIFCLPNNFDLYDKIPGTVMKQNAQDVFTHIVQFTMGIVVERWLDIANYFAWLIGHKDALSDPDRHDSLLFDDDTFSRSRRYFWAINYLAELDTSISENIVHLEKHISLQPSSFGIRSELLINKLVDAKALDNSFEKLKILRARLRAQRQEAIALRDGLFSASGVIESRASTRLGENVKLLTFVSIFFLPLSFCMSIWSVNNTVFSLKALLIVVILVGLGTYLVVFNLNNMVSFCSRIYDERKKNLIAQMRLDTDKHWHEQGKRFATFKPKQENFKPSEWVIGIFVLHKMLGWFSLSRLFKRKKKTVAEGGHGYRDSVKEWPGFPDSPDPDSSKNADPLKITRMQSTQNIAPEGPLSKLGKVLRRDALSPTMDRHV